MPDIRNIAGQRFGKLIALERIGKNKNRQSIWMCRCDCGREKPMNLCALVTGNTKSCGCAQNIKTHGESRTHKGKKTGSPEYKAWCYMKSRCLVKSATGYHNYGGRGIKVCDRWLDSFENFLADMGRKPSPKHSIDRIDNDGQYEPGNCRWASKKEQDTNRRQTRLMTLNGETLCLKDWAKRSPVKYDQFLVRINRGWPLERALTEPKTNKGRPRKE